MDGEHRGVPYAVTFGGELADPATAAPLVRGYRCLACKEFVFVKRGQVRVAHFAHYSDRDVACSRETVLHEAAKLRLRDMLRAGVQAFRLEVPCPGHRTLFGNVVRCSGENAAVVSLQVPSFDYAGVEVLFPPYRLDAAAVQDGSVMLALEVYQSHRVDEGKRAALASSGLPWLEVDAHAVLKQRMPWRAVSSSFGEIQCKHCREQTSSIERERQRLEAQRLAREERQQREAHERELKRRISYVAWDGHELRFPNEKPFGTSLTCPNCKKMMTVARLGQERVFLHAPEDASDCDPKRVWVRAGMIAIYRQLTRAKDQVRISRRCSGYGTRDCANILTESLPDFDGVHHQEPSLLLFKDGTLAGQIDFGRPSSDRGAPRRWWLKPSKVIKRPERWWQRRDGSLCPECQQLASEMERLRIERQRKIRDERAAVERREAEQRIAIHLAREPEMLEIARRSLAAFQLDPHWAAEQGVIVRHCENCVGLAGYVLATGLDAIPPHADSAFVALDGEIRCRCSHCGYPGSNNHDRFRALGSDLAGYEVRPEAIRGLATNPTLEN